MPAAQPYPHPPIRQDWLDQVREDIIEPERPIIDPHHHLWHNRPQGRYLIDELAQDLNTGHNIVATVFMQCAWMHHDHGPEAFRPVGETECVNAVATLAAREAYGRSKACHGIIGYADLRRPELEQVLQAHQKAGGGRFRGIRHIAAWDDAIQPTSSVVPPPGLLRDNDFLNGLRKLGALGFTFDAWLYHPQLHEMANAARFAPDTPIVIDHVGGPLGCGEYRGARDDVARTWRAGMQELAACPNVHVKLGGLAMPVNGFDYDKNDRPPTSEQLARDWKPWIEPCIEMFGPERCMFESNFPVDKGMCSYPVLWNAFKRLAPAPPRSEKAMLFHDTAARFYKLQ